MAGSEYYDREDERCEHGRDRGGAFCPECDTVREREAKLKRKADRFSSAAHDLMRLSGFGREMGVYVKMPSGRVFVKVLEGSDDG